jgi:hypothetical protein
LVDSVVYLHRVLGLNADDPNTTFPREHFNDLSYPILITGEDMAPNPLHLGLIILALVILFSKRLSFSGSCGLCGVTTIYSVTVLLGGILFCLMLRWQPGITRLQLPFFVLIGPAVATLLSTRLTRRSIFIVGVCLIFTALPSVFLNQRRPLWEAPYFDRLALCPNILTSDAWQQIFCGRGSRAWRPERPADAEAYNADRNAVKSIADRASGGVGLIVGNDNWEYLLWRMLKENHSTARVHIEQVCVPENGSPRCEQECVPENGSPRSTFQPETVLAIKRDQPAILICPNGVFEREATFPLGRSDDVISVYHRV